MTRTLRQWALGWAVASNQQARENARDASVHCSRALLERLEVEAYLTEHAASLTPAIDVETTRARAGGR